jgi:pyruvate/2-oxoglutarate dehydrogenase complex dihydrolipoamide acyltransferase (E2) component
MALEIRIPKLGLTMLDATLARWMVASGEAVVEEQSVCVIETDKVTYEVPSPGPGLVLPVAAAGRRLEVGALIGFVAADEGELGELAERHAQVAAGEPAPERTRAAVPPPEEPAAAVPRAAAGERIKASPVARALSREHGIDPATLSGSGPGGRIVKADVLAALAQGAAGRVAAGYDITPAAVEPELLRAAEEIPIRGIRKLIFQNMHLSLSRQAQLTLHTEASARGMVHLRQRINERLAADEAPVSFNGLIVKAVARALRRHPRLNATVDGRLIKVWEQVHIGVAMDFGRGLLVPKVREADRKSLQEISDEIRDLAERSEKKKLLPDELQNGTFTVTNLGAWETDHFTPIVNFPESAILGVGRIVEKPWVRQGAVVAEPRLALSLSFDHRIIDGAPAAAFLKTIKDMLEEPGLML